MLTNFSAVLLSIGLLASLITAPASGSSLTQSTHTATDPRIRAVIQSVAAQDAQLRSILVRYDFWSLDLSVPAKKRELFRSTITWARKGRKILYDETDHRSPVQGYKRTRHVYDGEKILSCYYRQDAISRQSRPAHTMVSDNKSLLADIRLGGNQIGLLYWSQPLSDLLRSRAKIRFLGYRRLGSDQCVVLHIQDPEHKYPDTHLWLDLHHGYILRRAQLFQDNRLQQDMSFSSPQRWAPGVFIATQAIISTFSDPGSLPERYRPTRPRVAHKTIARIRRVAVRQLPDSLFDANPRESLDALDGRTGNLFGIEPRRASEQHLRLVLKRAQAILARQKAPSRTTTVHVLRNVLSDDMACGPQSLYVICHLLGVKASVDELGRLAKMEKDGTSLQGLADAARTKGLAAYGTRLPLAKLRELREPVIFYALNHYYVLLGHCGGFAVCINPPGQIHLVSEKNLQGWWDGRVLVVRRRT
jgi:hypothetical protein